MRIYTTKELKIPTSILAKSFRLLPGVEVLEIGLSSSMTYIDSAKATIKDVKDTLDDGWCPYVHLDDIQLPSSNEFDEAVAEFLEFGDCWISIQKTRKHLLTSVDIDPNALKGKTPAKRS